MKPILSIIILNWNTKELLSDCVNSIFRKDKRLVFDKDSLNVKDEEKIPTELIVVDNASNDGSVEYLKKLSKTKKRVKVIFNKTNLGFVKGNNQALKKVEGQYVLLLNSDTILKEAAISQTLFWLSSRPEADIVGCKLVNSDGTPQPSFGSFPDLLTVFLMLFLERFGVGKRVRSSGNQIRQVDWVVGAFIMARKHIFDQVGGLDENIFMYMEEVEWFYRCSKMGFNCYFYPNAKVVHLGGASSATRTDPILYIYKGLIYFYEKHRTSLELNLLKLMLKTKALISLLIGKINKDNYLIETYEKAFHLV